MSILREKWTTWVLVLVLGYSARAIAQTEPLQIKDIASISYVSWRWAQPENSAKEPTSLGEDNTLVPDRGDSTAGTNGAPVEIPAAKKRFQWKPAARPEHVLSRHLSMAGASAHESGTRDALHGPFLKDWMDSIGETRGWDDGDGWHASYVSHPFEGGIFGFIEQQNDPLYRQAGMGRRTHLLDEPVARAGIFRRHEYAVDAGPGQ